MNKTKLSALTINNKGVSITFKKVQITILTCMFAVLLVDSVNPQQLAKADVRLVINEFMASNDSIIRDPQGQYDDWIEIYNYGTGDIDMAGMYLTDDLSEPAKWRIPSGTSAATTIRRGGYLLVWADNNVGDEGLHSNFKLSANGEEIGLFDSDGVTLIDSVEFNDQFTDMSYSRFPDAGSDWRYAYLPTPAGRNSNGYIDVVGDTKFSHDRGFYDEPFYVTIESNTLRATIRYTTDGSTPTETEGQVYSSPIRISTTTCLRAAAFKPGYMSTNVDTQTYIFPDDVIAQPKYPQGFPSSGWGHAGPDYEMDPIVVSRYDDTIRDDLKSTATVSLVMDVDDWFGSRGIYVNQSQDGTERVVSMEFIDPGEGKDFQLNCAISMQGGVSGGGTSLNRWKIDKLSMRPRFKAATDDGTPTGGPTNLEYKVFTNSDVDSFDTLLFDARLGNTWPYGGGVTDSGSRPWISGRPIYQPDVAQYTRDQFVADIQNALGGYSHHGRHVHLYINGLYWGIYNLHERPDHRFAASYFGGDADDYDCIKHNSNQVINGSNATFNEMLNIAESGLVSNSRYQLIQQYLDVDNFIDYLIPNYYVGNYDWGHKNWYATHNSADPNGLWRFHHWDGEHLMENLYENVTGRDNVGGPSHLHQLLAQNAEYRLLFADHVHRHFFNDGNLTPEGAAALYQIRLDDVDRAVVCESARWGDNQIDRFAHIRYMRDPHWLLERDWLLGTYFPNRTDIVLNQFKSRGWYPGIDAPIFNINSSYQHGGNVVSGDRLSMQFSGGSVWYTLDGSDPRMAGTSQQDNSVETVLVPGDSDKRILVPTGPVSNNWKGIGLFNDTSWLSCTGNPGGVGYEVSSGYENYISLDVSEQMYGNLTSCYIRIPFNIEGSPSDFDLLNLNVRYDDGFVAYLNGAEIARVNFSGTPDWNSQADSGHEAGTVPETFNVSGHISRLKSGQNILAIHGLNLSVTSSDFLVWAELKAEKTNTVPGSSDISPSALRYTGPITLTESVRVKARLKNSNTWSALNEAVFSVGSPGN